MDEAKRTAVLLETSLLSAAVFLGTNPVAVKYAVEGIPPLPFVALRFTLAGLLVLAFPTYTPMLYRKALSIARFALSSSVPKEVLDQGVYGSCAFPRRS